jgi:hypothetical protein
MEETVVIINTYKLEKLLEESLEETFKQVEEELKNYNWDFIPEYITIDSNG